MGEVLDLRDIIAEVNDKKRIGVCIDTCHIFAAGTIMFFIVPVPF